MLSNPLLKNFRSVYLYLLFWVSLSVVYALLLYLVIGTTLSTALADSFVFNFILSFLGLSFWYPARFISFESNKVGKIFLAHLTGSVLASTIWLITGYYFITATLGLGETYSTFFYSTLSWRFIIGLLIYFLITSLYYIIIYYTGFHERILREADLRNLVTEAELKSLKFQINPHFIFNSLNSMSALTTLDPSKAKEMILKLADFLRYTLANNVRQTNKLSEELKNIRLYLEIEKIRFEDKFEYIEELAEDTKSIPVPNMILQPLFENAIKHAVYETLEKVTLKMNSVIENNFLKLTLENNFDPTAIAKKGAGVGIQNIKNRLELLYHQNNLIEVKKDEKTFSVILYIPLGENVI
ncbi:MAG: histidine kinase [Ignavibacteriales bacterium]|nr:MAG: histidine kinase [Ignavibacteriales bacterium]